MRLSYVEYLAVLSACDRLLGEGRLAQLKHFTMNSKESIAVTLISLCHGTQVLEQPSLVIPPVAQQ